MAKLFVFSDPHGFYDILIRDLKAAGWDRNNPDHWLIGLGDYFDRGKQPKEIMNFLMNTPRTILVRGNHEDLLLDMCDRHIQLSHDLSNGTFETAQLLTNQKNPSFDQVKEKVTPFINKMVNYFETKNYIFVHSFVPTFKEEPLPAYYTRDTTHTFNPSWRHAHFSDWCAARWGNPFKLSIQFADKLGKTIVFGHWHTADAATGRNGRLFRSEQDEKDFSIFYGDNYIGIDGCVAYTRKQNVLVLEDDFIEED